MERPVGICILAAGKGTRMKSSVPKVLQPLAGAPMIEYVLDSVTALSPAPVQLVVITGYGADDVEQAVAGLPAFAGSAGSFVRQDQQLGTGHAMQVAAHSFHRLAGDGGDLLLVLGDVPLITAATLEKLLAHHRSLDAAATMLTLQVENPAGYGRVMRNEEGYLAGVVEDKDATAEQRLIREVNSGIFAFRTQALLDALPGLSNDNAAGEYYLPDVIPLMMQAGGRCAAMLCDDPDELMGVNSFRHLAVADRVLRHRIMGHLMDSGVRIVDPDSTYIDKGVAIGPETTILPHTVIRRGVTIGSGCEVGPFAHLRVGTTLADTAEIGNFVECKKATVGPHTKAKHLTYLGDVTLGANTNVGAGTVICNYDGRNKHHTTIGNRVFIGSGSMIVAPRTIADESRTGAGSVVTKDVPGGTTVVGIPARPIRRFKK